MRSPSTAQQVATLTRAIRAVKACGLRARNVTVGETIVLAVYEGERGIGLLTLADGEMIALAPPDDMGRMEAVCAAYEEAEQ